MEDSNQLAEKKPPAAGENPANKYKMIRRAPSLDEFDQSHVGNIRSIIRMNDKADSLISIGMKDTTPD